MRVKTAITLPEDLLAAIDRVQVNRSAFLETAARARLAELERIARDTHDMEIYERNAARLNQEAEEVLGFQNW